jgi:hypothetical protein
MTSFPMNEDNTVQIRTSADGNWDAKITKFVNEKKEIPTWVLLPVFSLGFYLAHWARSRVEDEEKCKGDACDETKRNLGIAQALFGIMALTSLYYAKLAYDEHRNKKMMTEGQ